MKTKMFVIITLLLAKILVALLAWEIVGSGLGDTPAYLKGEFLYRENLLSTAYIMSLTGTIITSILGYTFYANLPLLLIAWHGVSKPIFLLKLSKKHWIGLLALLMSPSYLTWSSIHSKEAVMNLILGVLVSYFISLTLNKKISNLKVSVLFLALALFKPFYLPAFFWIYFFLLLTRNNKLNLTNILMIFIIITISLASILYFNYNYLSHQATIFNINFSSNGTLTRDRQWNSLLDLISSIPQGLPISFIGPTFEEALKRKDLLALFIEGLIGITSLLYLLYKSCIHKGILIRSRLLMLGGFLFLLLLAHFPFGYFNPGSAIRYKQSFYAVTIIILFFFAFDKRVRITKEATQ